MNFKHGFCSTNPLLNGDMRMLQGVSLTVDDLAYVESFLFGDTCSDPIKAHGIAKAVFLCGNRKYPTLWPKAEKYVNGYEYQTMEKLSLLGEVKK